MRNLKALLGRVDIFSLGVSTIAYYLLVFYVTPFLGVLRVPFVSIIAAYHVPHRMLGYVAAGIAAFAAGWVLRIPRLAAFPSRFLRRNWREERLPIVFGIVFSVGLAGKVIKVLGGAYAHLNISPAFARSPFYSAVGFMDWFSSFALLMAFVAYYHFTSAGSTSARRWHVIAWSAFALELAYAIPTCSRTLILVPILLYLVARWYLWKRSVLPMLLVGFVVAVIFPWGNVCRLATSNGSAEISVRVAPAVTAQFVADSLLRIDQSKIVDAIIAHPRPLLLGRSLADFFLRFGPPQFIWKNKPPSVNAGGNDLGRAIGVLHPTDYVTSVGPTTIGDWYMNFGVWGIVFGMLFFGVLFRAIYDVLIVATGSSPSGVLFYGIAWLQLLGGVESFIAPVLAGLVKIMILLFFINLFLVKKERMS